MILFTKAHPATQAMSAARAPVELNEPGLRRNPGEPSAEQAEASTYNKPRIKWQGLTIAVENPAGSVRRGRNRHGVTWEVRMRFDYGEILGSMGVDGDPVDIYMGPNPEAPTVYVVHQRRVNDWTEYDEDKCMLGFDCQADAEAAFLSNYNDPRFLGPITAMPVAEFVAKVRATKDQPAMIKAAAPVVLFFKAHVGAYLRGGKMVNLSGYQGRAARAVATPGQLSLFGSNEHVSPGPAESAPDLIEDDLPAVRQYSRMTPAERAAFDGRNGITQSRRELVAEHERLVDVLNSPSREDDKVEAKRQEKELAEYKQEDTQALREKLQTLHDFLEVNPASASAPAWRAKISEIEGKIGPLHSSKPAPKAEVDTSKWGEPAKAAHALSKEYASLDKLNAKAVGAFKTKLRSLAKKTPEDDAHATLIIDGLVTKLWGTDYNPKVAGVEFAPAGLSVAEEPDHLLADMPGAKWRRGKGLVRDHYGVEVGGEVVGNYHEKPEDAVAAARQVLASRAEHAKRIADDSAAIGKLRERLLAGGEVTDMDLKLLGLKDGSSGLEWFIPAAAKVFGISSRAVRPHIADMIRIGHTDIGAKKEFVSPKKALHAMAASIKPNADYNAAVTSTREGPTDNDPRRKFYVTVAREGRGVRNLAGPFDTHDEAKAHVHRAREAANELDPRSAFDAFGTAGVVADKHEPGMLNFRVIAGGLDPASMTKSIVFLRPPAS